MDNIKKYTVASVTEFLDTVTKINKTNQRTFYRGQADEAWEITSSAYRTMDSPSRKKLMDRHLKLLKEVRKLSNVVERKDILLLSDLQHNGAETILIDYSLSPLVSLWFACIKHKDKDGAVYCLQNKGLSSYLAEIGGDENIQDLFQDMVVSETNRKKLRSKQIYVYHPSHLNQRIINQQSVFVIGLSGKVDKRDHTKIVIDKDAKDNILEELAILGISVKTLFPDYNGFIEWFSYGIHDECITLISEAENFYREYNYKEAIEKYKEIEKLAKETYGERSPFLATVYNDLGVTLSDFGSYMEAFEYHRKALSIRLEFQGEGQIDIARSYNNIGRALASTGDYSSALSNYEKALSLYIKAYGEDHPDIATTYTNMGHSYVSLKERQLALEHYEKALAIREDVFGYNHLDTARAYNNIAGVHSANENYEQAAEYHNKALHVLLENYGEEHPDTARSYNNIGVYYAKSGEYEQALKHYLQALEIREKILGEEHPDTAITYGNIGTVIFDQGENNEKAKWYYNKALRIYRATVGEEHPRTKNILEKLKKIEDRL